MPPPPPPAPAAAAAATSTSQRGPAAEAAADRALRCYMRNHVRELRRAQPGASEAQLKSILTGMWAEASEGERKEMEAVGARQGAVRARGGRVPVKGACCPGVQRDVRLDLFRTAPAHSWGLSDAVLRSRIVACTPCEQTGTFGISRQPPHWMWASAPQT